VPYIYEKLQQEMTVSDSYSEAMDYYQQRINNLLSIAKLHQDFSSTNMMEIQQASFCKTTVLITVNYTPNPSFITIVNSIHFLPWLKIKS